MKEGSPSRNWLGAVAGALMVVLPFLGPWWVGRAGAGAFEVSFSPFDVSINLLGNPIHSNIVDLFLLAAKIAMILGGVFLILGSIFAKRWWSKRLVRFGLMKPFWSVVGIVALLVLGALIANYVLPTLLSNLVAGGATGVTIDLNIPYVVGTSNSTIRIGDMATITAPISFSLTWVFWFAVAVAALAIAARVYHRRFTRAQSGVST